MLKDAGGESEGRAGVSADEDAGRGRVLACARCQRVITTAAERIEISGAHEHKFDNPDGLRFRIGCFANASGLLRVGPASLEWTWFAGYTWQSQVCAGCRDFLGWLYRKGDHRFHGLVLTSLIEIDEN